MRHNFFEIVKEYTEIPVPVGDEKLVADRLLDDWKNISEKIWYTKTRNIIAKIGGKGPKLLITVHMDEINLLVKAMDDHLALALMTILASELKFEVLKLNYELYFAGTIMEEIALAGASSIGSEVNFNLAITLEIGLTGDIPTVSMNYMPTSLGKGPIIAHKDSVIFYSEKIYQLIENTAIKASINIQHAVFHGFEIDGIELIKEDISTALFTFPARYTHSPYEMINDKDIFDMIDVLKHFLSK